jgi:hypothetical protein
MVKKTPLQFVIAFFVAFSLSFMQTQSCYAGCDTGGGGDGLAGETGIAAAVVGTAGLTALLLWLFKDKSDNSKNLTCQSKVEMSPPLAK